VVGDSELRSQGIEVAPPRCAAETNERCAHQELQVGCMQALLVAVSCTVGTAGLIPLRVLRWSVAALNLTRSLRRMVYAYVWVLSSVVQVTPSCICTLIESSNFSATLYRMYAAHVLCERQCMHVGWSECGVSFYVVTTALESFCTCSVICRYLEASGCVGLCVNMCKVRILRRLQLIQCCKYAG
jgi:hypothetical protein